MGLSINIFGSIPVEQVVLGQMSELQLFLGFGSHCAWLFRNILSDSDPVCFLSLIFDPLFVF